MPHGAPARQCDSLSPHHDPTIRLERLPAAGHLHLRMRAKTFAQNSRIFFQIFFQVARRAKSDRPRMHGRPRRQVTHDGGRDGGRTRLRISPQACLMATEARGEIPTAMPPPPEKEACPVARVFLTDTGHANTTAKAGISQSGARPPWITSRKLRRNSASSCPSRSPCLHWSMTSRSASVCRVWGSLLR